MTVGCPIQTRGPKRNSETMSLPVANVTIDGKLVEATDTLLQHTGLSGLSAVLSDVLSSWIAPLHREQLVERLGSWARSFTARCAEVRYANERQIPFVLLPPAFRAAAEEDDATMLDLQAWLLAGFRNADRADAPNKTFISILSEMRPIDFQVLRLLVSGKAPTQGGGLLRLEGVGLALGVSESSVRLAAQNLVRLACLRLTNIPATDHRTSALPVTPAGLSLRDGRTIYTPMELGVALLNALDEPQTADRGPR